MRIHGWLLALTVMLSVSVVSAAEKPAIVRVQGVGDVVTLWGVGLAGPGTEAYGWDAPFDRDKALQALVAGKEGAAAFLPAAPPAGARRLEVLQAEERGLVMAARIPYGGRFNFPQVVWVKNASGTSVPYATGQARPWMVYPELTQPGERVRVFGRNMGREMIALRGVDDGKVRLITPGVSRARNGTYETDFDLPADLKPGDYDIFIHNGRCGPGAWGGPLRLGVTALPEVKEPRVLNARDYGAVGDGLTDDTAALRKALVEAGESGADAVYLPPGRYAVSGTLWTPKGVTLRGAGSENSILCVNPDRPMRWDVPKDIAAAMPGHFRGRQQGPNLGAMLWMQDNSRVRDVGFEDGPGVLQAIFAQHTGVSIERCRFRMLHCTITPIMVEWGSYGFTLKECDILGPGALMLVHGPQTQAYIGYNTMRSRQLGENNVLFVRGTVDSIIEENDVSGGDRVFSSQRGPSRHTVLLGNHFYAGTPRRHNSGESMIENNDAGWNGRILSADRRSITVEGEPFAANQAGTWLLVLDGRGLGQYRLVTENTKNKLVLDRDWEITPDKSSFLRLAAFNSEWLWLDNTEENIAGWTGFWGNNIGHVIDGCINRGGDGIYLWGVGGDRTVAFVDILNSWLSNRGNVVLKGDAPVFGNTVHLVEITSFRYRPSQHGTIGWAHPRDADALRARQGLVDRAGVLIAGGKRAESLPATMPFRDWNIIDRVLVTDGPRGIVIEAGAGHTILNRNVVNVDGKAVSDAGSQTCLSRDFTEDEKAEVKPVAGITGKAAPDATPVAGKNLAAGITPTSSLMLQSEVAGVFTDGKTEGHIGGGAGPQYLQVDLGKIFSLSRIRLWHYFADRRNYFGVIVQLSEDAEFRKGVVTLFNNDYDNSSGQGIGSDPLYTETPEGLTLDFKAVRARYVRCWLNGNSNNMANHWSEIQVFEARK